VVETHDVRLAGGGPAAEAVVAALEDVGVTPARVDTTDLVGADLGIVVGTVGDETLSATTTVTDAVPVVAVETGGVGGHRVSGVEAAVLGLGAGACYDCVRTRVAAAEPAVETGTDDSTDEPVPAPARRLAGATAGRAAVARLRGEPTPVFPSTPDGDPLGGVVEVPHATRRVLPVPGCSCDGGGRFRALDLEESGTRDTAAAVERAELALDERVGPVAEVGELESFPVPYYMARLSATEAFSDAEVRRRAAGVDPDWNRALMRALGEALERYAAAVYRAEDVHRAPLSAVPNAVGPGEFVRPDDAPAVDATEPLEWVVGVNLAARLGVEDGAGGDDRVSLPAEAALFPPPTERHLRPVTTGLGLGNGPAEAVRSGLTEVVERDAAMLSWYSTFEPLGLAVEDDAYETLVRRARSEDLSVSAVLVTVDVDVPVVVAAVHREEWPRLAVGTDADLDPTAAARGALTEALQNWTELRSMGRSEAGEEPTAIARYAADPGPVRRLLDADRVPADSVADTAGGLSTLVERVTDAGLRPYAVDLTTRDLERAGFAAVRVVVPGAQPLFVDVDSPVFGERAERVPAELGFEPRLDGPAHPFP